MTAMPDDLRAYIVDLADHGDGLLPVRRALARCSTCDWTAVMSGDDDSELTAFLHALLMEHVTRLHPRH